MEIINHIKIFILKTSSICNCACYCSNYQPSKIEEMVV